MKASDPRHREHVTLYLWDNSHEYHLLPLMAPKELAYPSLRFDVDTPQDLNYLTILTHYGVSITTCAISIVSIALALKTPRLVTTDICNDPDLNFVDTYFWVVGALIT